MLEYLLTRLEDEFRAYPEVRVRPVFPSGTRKSPDLHQDYDPESQTVHRNAGVRVQVRGHEFFFAVTGENAAARADYEVQVREIRALLGLSD